MSRRIILIVILVAAAAFGYYYYKHHQEEVRLANGEVICDGCMTPAEHARFLKENSGESADAQSERRAKAPVTPDSAATTTSSTSTGNAAADTSSPAQPAPAAAPVTATVSNAPAAAPPAADTVAPNPTNGMVFAGKGTYQWYRQGNLTWRVDTTSGRSCIIYATMEEWRKPLVISHGCGRSA